MPTPLSVQLYTFRDAMAADRPGTLARVASLGFQAVEPFGLGSGSAAEMAGYARALRADLDAAGLVVSAVHCRAPVGADAGAVLDAVQTVGADTLIVPSPGAVDGFGTDTFATLDGIRQFAVRLNQAAAAAAARGLGFGYHNHWFEFTGLGEGRTGYAALFDHLDPQVLAEVDVYWAQTGGADPAALVTALGDRVRFLHVKDGPAVREAPQVPVGSGSVDNVGAIEAARSARFHVVEFDSCATDVFTAARDSGSWLAARGYSTWQVGK